MRFGSRLSNLDLNSKRARCSIDDFFDLATAPQPVWSPAPRDAPPPNSASDHKRSECFTHEPSSQEVALGHLEVTILKKQNLL